jgi:peptide/nickel transport system substrate-binding protein
MSRSLRSHRRVPAAVRLVALVATLSIVLLPAAVALADTASPQAKSVLRVGWVRDPDNLNPFIGYTTEAYEVWRLNYDMLTGFDAATLEPTPELATEWSTSADGKTWTYKLREGVKWQDGEPFTSADVVFTFMYIIDNELGNFTSYTTYIDDVVAIDDLTVEFRCSQPKANMLGLWVPIVPRHIWEKVSGEDAQSTYINEPPIVGTGPFQCVEWKKDNFIRMTANEDYWRGAPKVDEIIFETFKNPDTMVQQMRNGTLAAAVNIPEAQFAPLGEVPGVSTVAFVQKGFVELSINAYDSPDSQGNPVLKDPAFRNALQWAIDRQAIAKIAWAGYATPATSLLPSGYYQEPLDYHWDPAPGSAYSFDIAKAKAALDAAGYKDTDGDGIREYKGEPIELSLIAISNDVHAPKMGKLVAGWLQQAGIGVKYEVTDDGSLYDLVWNTKGDKAAPSYDLCLWGPWTGDVDPNWIFSIFTTDQIGDWSASYWSNAEFDQLYEKQQTELDPQARKDMFLRMQEIMYEESPVIFMVYPKMLEAYNTGKWTGWVSSPAKTGGVLFTSDNIDSYLFVHPKAAVVESRTNWGAIVGAIVGGLAVVGIVVWLVLRRRRPHAETE